MSERITVFFVACAIIVTVSAFFIALNTGDIADSLRILAGL